MTARIFVHVGLPKTATTTVQDELFPTVPGIVYLGAKGIVRAAPPLVEAGAQIARAITFQAREIAYGGPISDGLGQARDRILAIDGTVVLSEERWTGTAVEVDYAPGAHVPAALNRLFGEAWSAIVILREPLAHAASWLLQTMVRSPVHIRRPDGIIDLGGPRAALEWHLARAETDPRSIFRTGCRFDSVVEPWQAAVGAERLHLLAFERLFEDEQSCRRAFAALFGVSADGPPLGRRNEASADKRREIARRHLRAPEDAERVERFVTAWAKARAVVAGHPGARQFTERHSLPVWRAVAGLPTAHQPAGEPLQTASGPGSVTAGR